MSDGLPATPETADVETASEDYARRFAGPVGEWFVEVQTRSTLELVAPWTGGRVVDVGGGHAQLAPPLAAAGFDVTVVGSAPACRARLPADDERIHFEVGDLVDLPFDEDAFDIALAYRLLPHVTRWERLVGELCRVARHAVVVDYPTSRSVNAVADAFFGLKKRVEGNTRTFRVFLDDELEDAFASAGFRATGRRPQFAWPMALHRAAGSARLSRGLEAVAGGLGLTRALGSPVIARFQPGADPIIGS